MEDILERDETVGGTGRTEERVIRKERSSRGGEGGGRAGEINGPVDRKMSKAREQHCVA